MQLFISYQLVKEMGLPNNTHCRSLTVLYSFVLDLLNRGEGLEGKNARELSSLIFKN